MNDNGKTHKRGCGSSDATTALREMEALFPKFSDALRPRDDIEGLRDNWGAVGQMLQASGEATDPAERTRLEQAAIAATIEAVTCPLFNAEQLAQWREGISAWHDQANAREAGETPKRGCA